MAAASAAQVPAQRPPGIAVERRPGGPRRLPLGAWSRQTAFMSAVSWARFNDSRAFCEYRLKVDLPITTSLNDSGSSSTWAKRIRATVRGSEIPRCCASFVEDRL